MKSYLFFIFLFFIIFLLYKFYVNIFSKIEFLMKYVMFGVGILTISFPIIMNNMDKISNLIRKRVKKN